MFVCHHTIRVLVCHYRKQLCIFEHPRGIDACDFILAWKKGAYRTINFLSIHSQVVIPFSQNLAMRKTFQPNELGMPQLKIRM